MFTLIAPLIILTATMGCLGNNRCALAGGALTLVVLLTALISNPNENSTGRPLANGVSPQGPSLSSMPRRHPETKPPKATLVTDAYADFAP
jgi:hypothetical protein